MPEAVAAHAAGLGAPQIVAVQDNIVAAYRDDFAKYEKKSLLPLLQTVYDRLPAGLGQKVIYAKLAPGDRADKIRECITHLAQARVVRRIYHSHADGLPLGAQSDDKVFKCYWLDIGLMNHMLGVLRPFVTADDQLFHAGVIAEQFVAQHLAGFLGPLQPSSSFYWLREGRSGNSEVDFLVMHDRRVVPIEVKSGTSGSMKSLLQFVALKKVSRAVKLSLAPPAVERCSHQVVGPKGSITVAFELLHLPLYFVEQLARILGESSNL